MDTAPASVVERGRPAAPGARRPSGRSAAGGSLTDRPMRKAVGTSGGRASSGLLKPNNDASYIVPKLLRPRVRRGQ